MRGQDHTSRQPHVLVTAELPDFVLKRFGAHVRLTEGPLEAAQDLAPDALLCSIAETRLSAQRIEALPNSVRAILTFSVGLDHIDIAAARQRGIAVMNTPRVLGDAVADAAMLLILGASRRVTESISLLRSGRWSGWTPSQLIGLGLADRVLGIFGMGDIGARVAHRARAFGLQIVYHNRGRRDDEPNATWLPATELLAKSDVILLAWPSTPETRHFIDHRALELVKSTAVLVNVGRGDLVCDDDLIEALRSGRLYAAGLDVFENEPAIDPRYLDLPNAFLLPHIGSSTVEARLGMAAVLSDALQCWWAGGSPQNQVA